MAARRRLEPGRKRRLIGVTLNIRDVYRSFKRSAGNGAPFSHLLRYICEIVNSLITKSIKVNILGLLNRRCRKQGLPMAKKIQGKWSLVGWLLGHGWSQAGNEG